MANDMDRQPRYQRLADGLIGDIQSGVLRVGSTLPGELELVERHHVSRHTVREALRKLTELGLIERRQGIGTVVRARRTTQSYSHTVRSPAELLRYPAESRLYVQSSNSVRTGRQLSKQMGVAVGTQWQCIGALRRLRSAKLPICWVDIFVLPEFASIAELIGRRPQMVYELIEQKYGERLATVEVDVRAELVPEALAEALMVDPGSPSLCIVRRYISQSRRVVEVSVSHHPSDRYSFALELQRGWRSEAG